MTQSAALEPMVAGRPRNFNPTGIPAIYLAGRAALLQICIAEGGPRKAESRHFPCPVANLPFIFPYGSPGGTPRRLTSSGSSLAEMYLIVS